MDKKISLPVFAATVLLVLVAAFAGGYFMHAKTSTAGNRQMMARMAGGPGGRASSTNNGGKAGSGAQFLSGEIIKNDDNSVTLKLADGGSKTVYLNASSTITKSQAASKGDLVTGEKVSVGVKTGTDGNLVAQFVQLGEAAMPGGNGPDDKQAPADGQVPTDSQNFDGQAPAVNQPAQ